MPFTCGWRQQVQEGNSDLFIILTRDTLHLVLRRTDPPSKFWVHPGLDHLYSEMCTISRQRLSSRLLWHALLTSSLWLSTAILLRKLISAALYPGSCSFGDPHRITIVEGWSLNKPVNLELLAQFFLHNDRLERHSHYCWQGLIHCFISHSITHEQDSKIQYMNSFAQGRQHPQLRGSIPAFLHRRKVCLLITVLSQKSQLEVKDSWFL